MNAKFNCRNLKINLNHSKILKGMCHNVDRKHVKWIEIDVTLTDMNATVTTMNVITTEKDRNERN